MQVRLRHSRGYRHGGHRLLLMKWEWELGLRLLSGAMDEGSVRHCYRYRANGMRASEWDIFALVGGRTGVSAVAVAIAIRAAEELHVTRCEFQGRAGTAA